MATTRNGPLSMKLEVVVVPVSDVDRADHYMDDVRHIGPPMTIDHESMVRDAILSFVMAK